jgi:hypothetical protein
LVKNGTLPKASRGAYSLPKVVAAFVRYRIDAGPAAMAAEKVRLTREQADAQALKNEIKRGGLMYVEHIQQIFAAFCVEMVAQFESIPGRAVAALSGETDPGMQRGLILAVARDSRHYLANWIARIPPDFADWQAVFDQAVALIPKITPEPKPK